jgi:hypothetical protein
MFTPYQPRPLAFLGVESVAEYRLKVYAISYGDEPFSRDRFAGGWALASKELPQPGVAAQRPGVGFAILHQGKTGDYLILCWWDRENELPTQVFVKDTDGWRPARAGESFCVWDLRVIWWEREAYIATVLAGREGGFEQYVTSVVEGYA